ncbi:MAG: YraN family protein [Bacteroidales bacterium]|nr:YraN family protein [Bacteroidales bacterium]
MNEKGELGRAGEKKALDFLLGLGQTLVAQNWRYGHLEIDLITEDRDAVRIIEVKTLHEGDNFSPLDNVTKRKRQRIIAAAKAFFGQNPSSKEVVFDVVAVVASGDDFNVEYYPYAFDALG